MKLFCYLFSIVLLVGACRRTPDVDRVSSVDLSVYDKAYDFLDQKQSDSAFYYFNQSKEIFQEENDSLNTANCLINMGEIQRGQGDFYGTQETSLLALDYLNTRVELHRPYLSSAYNMLAMAASALQDFNQAISFYEKAIQFSDDSVHTFTFRNNLAIAYQRQGKDKEALALFQDLLKNTHKEDPKEYARVLSNYAHVEGLEKTGG